MTIIRRSGPFGDLLSLRQAMDRLFEESFVNPGSWQFGDGQLVPMDVVAGDGEIVVEAILPGIKPEDVDITVEGNALTIAGDTTSANSPKAGSVLLKEIRRGRFTRTLTLPDGLEPDNATATFEDGVLTLRIPKAERVKPRQIKITTGQGQFDGDSEHAEPATVEAK
ncbi:MAG TPA: Hsp20/alpha crystallin family protein [Candidatus Limnocylindrales bacterium]|jgi:HSP20 family protein